jgi:hypothetical protein
MNLSRRDLVKGILLAFAGVLVCLWPESAIAKKKNKKQKGGGNRGRGRNRGGRGRGRGGRRAGFKSITVKHTGVFKRMGEDTDWIEERHKDIRERHAAAMQAIRASGNL